MSDWGDYFRAIEDGDERREWTPDELIKGVVPAALRGLAACVHSGSPIAFTVEHPADGVVALAEDAVSRGFHFALIGVEDLKSRARIRALARDRCRESLVLCVWPDLHCVDFSHARFVIPFFPRDIRALATQQVTIKDLLAFKLCRRHILDRSGPELAFSGRLMAEHHRRLMAGEQSAFEPLLEAINRSFENHRLFVEHPLCAEVTSELRRRRGVLISGPSSSGKTVLATQVGRPYAMRGERAVNYSNLGDFPAYPASLIEYFFYPTAGAPLTIVDDLQSNPAVARFLLYLASAARRARRDNWPALVAISWDDYSREAADWFEQCRPFVVQPYMVRAKLTTQYREYLGADELESLATRLGDDLLLLRLSLEEGKRSKKTPALAAVAEQVWEAKTRGIEDFAPARRVALVAASLGRYDIAAPAEFLSQEAASGDDVVDQLTTTRLLRKKRDLLTLGHRSLCALLADWLGSQGVWQDLEAQAGLKSADDVVHDFLRSLGPSLAVDQLRALQARAGWREDSELHQRSLAIIETWRNFDAIVGSFEEQQATDPTWNSAPSSAAFAAMTLASLGKRDVALRSLEFLRANYSLDDDAIEVTTGQFSTVEDFRLIGDKMRAQDANQDQAVPEPYEAAADVDLDRMHATWVVGLIAGAEAALEEDGGKLDRLADAIGKLQIHESGAFYPHRAPWVTARVVLGLAACGRTFDSSTSVRRAVEWLLLERDKGGARVGDHWEGGTGDWNRPLETTALVLLALAKVGFDCSHESLDATREFLLNECRKVISPKRAIDAACGLEAFVEVGGEWEKVAQVAQRLSRVVYEQSFWGEARLPAEKLQAQTCTVAQVAYHLISVSWSAIRSDLPTFLAALGLPASFREEMELRPEDDVDDDDVVPPSAAHARDRADTVLEAVLGIEDLRLSRYKVLGNYYRYEERARSELQRWGVQLQQALDPGSRERENFLIWAPPGSGKTFFVEEVARSITDIRYVELNLADMSKDEFVAGLAEVEDASESVLCLIDEADARADEKWPYEECFSMLDLNTKRPHAVVFVLVGSSESGIVTMARAMESPRRSKGKDLVDRVPSTKQFEIPTLALEDRAVVLASHLLGLASKRGQQLREIERMALYYVMSGSAVASPRRLQELAKSTIRNLSTMVPQVWYDSLFQLGDRTNQSFWAEHQHAASLLQGRFVAMKT